MSGSYSGPYSDKEVWVAPGTPFEFNGYLWLWSILEPRVRLVVDVGADHELTFPDEGRVVQHCFEPVPEEFQKLSTFRREHVVVNRTVLVASHPPMGVVPFYGHSKKTFGCAPECSCRSEVPATTLDLYAHERKLGPVDLLNVCVGGGELEVLKGATQTLKRTTVVLWEHQQGASSDVFTFLAEQGFVFICMLCPSHLYLLPKSSSSSSLAGLEAKSGGGPRKDAYVRKDGYAHYLAAKSQEALDALLKPRAVDLLSNHPLPPSSVKELLRMLRPPPTFEIVDHKDVGMKFVRVSAPLQHTSRVDLDFGPDGGFNMALTTATATVGGEVAYVGSLRRLRNPNGNWNNWSARTMAERKYPELESIYSLVYFDRDFRIRKTVEMKDTTGRPKHKNYTTGLEDCRLIDDHSLLAVTLDTNPDWRSDVSFVRFSPVDGEIKEVRPLSVQGLKGGSEKNWLALRHWGNEFHILHWYNPLRVIRVDVGTGKGSILKEVHNHPAFNFTAHGGACVRVGKQFLVSVRVYRRHHYAHSRWILLDDQYDIVGVSPPFRFQNTYYYEMCMSLTLSDSASSVVAAVSMEDKRVSVFTYLLADILSFVSNDTMSALIKR